MDHVENVEIEEIVEIIREFTKHGEEVVDKEKLQLRVRCTVSNSRQYAYASTIHYTK